MVYISNLYMNFEVCIDRFVLMAIFVGEMVLPDGL